MTLYCNEGQINDNLLGEKDSHIALAVKSTQMAGTAHFATATYLFFTTWKAN